jgi:hypothetical protein
MPTLLHPHLRRRLGCLAALTVTLIVIIPGAAYASSCPAQPTTTPFAQWGDTTNYFLLQGSNFEAPLADSGWTVYRAERTLTSRPSYVGSSGRGDSYALTIESGGTAISPPFCIDASTPDFRFFAHALGANGNLQVRLVMPTATGWSSTPLDVADLTAASMPNWAPTAPINLPDGLTTGQSALGRLVFDVAGPSSWQIDDVYVDPYRTG